MTNGKPSLADCGEELFNGRVRCRLCGKWCASWLGLDERWPRVQCTPRNEFIRRGLWAEVHEVKGNLAEVTA